MGKWFHKGEKEEEQIPDTKKPQQNSGPKIIKAFTMNDMHYELTAWSKLPAKARKAAEGLGYDSAKWDNSEWVDISDWHWHDLSDEQKKNAETLGWTEEAWEHQYNDSDWKDLPQKVQKAAAKAGFDQEKWDDDEWPENLEKEWDDLAEKDREAMAVLGYTKNVWD